MIEYRTTAASEVGKVTPPEGDGWTLYSTTPVSVVTTKFRVGLIFVWSREESREVEEERSPDGYKAWMPNLGGTEADSWWHYADSPCAQREAAVACMENKLGERPAGSAIVRVRAPDGQITRWAVFADEQEGWSATELPWKDES